MIRVMTVVRDSPRKEWGPEEGVSHETQDVIDNFMIGERSVTAFMANDPYAGED